MNALDLEMLDRLAAAPHFGTAAVPALFGGFRPRWAEDAIDRLLLAGLVGYGRPPAATPSGHHREPVYRITPAGRAAMADAPRVFDHRAIRPRVNRHFVPDRYLVRGGH